MSVYVDDIKLPGKKQNIDPMLRILMNQVELVEPTSFLDHVYLGCTQRECETNDDIVDNFLKYVRVQDVRRSYGKTTQLRET